MDVVDVVDVVDVGAIAIEVEVPVGRVVFRDGGGTLTESIVVDVVALGR